MCVCVYIWKQNLEHKLKAVGGRGHRARSCNVTRGGAGGGGGRARACLLKALAIGSTEVVRAGRRIVRCKDSRGNQILHRFTQPFQNRLPCAPCVSFHCFYCVTSCFGAVALGCVVDGPWRLFLCRSCPLGFCVALRDIVAKVGLRQTAGV